MATNPKAWIGLAAIITILTVIGPFGTLLTMGFSQRIVYWTSILIITFPIALFCSIYISVLLSNFGMPNPMARIIAGAIAGLPTGTSVWLFHLAIGRIQTLNWPDYLVQLYYSIPLATSISLIFYLLEKDDDDPNQEAKEPGNDHRQSPFFKRLPISLGRDLICLEAQDHYIKVTTLKGSQMVLQRLTDAIDELSTYPGTRVHRSWWVAHAHIQDMIRKNDRWVITLTNGQEIPVSRTYLDAARQVKHSLSLSS